MIIVTGASRGLGKFVCENYALGRMPVIGIYNNTEPDRSCCLQPNTDVEYVKLDVTKEDQVKEFVSTRKLNKVTLLHFAGINKNGVIHKIGEEEWDQVHDVNVKSAYLLVKHLMPVMKNDKYGRIVFCSSVVPQMGVAGTAAYASSKAALWGLAKTIAKEGAARNITCNCLNLGYMDAGMTATEVPKEMLEQIVSTIPMNRLGDPMNVMHAVEFLRSADYVTGTCIDINGGLV